MDLEKEKNRITIKTFGRWFDVIPTDDGWFRFAGNPKKFPIITKDDYMYTWGFGMYTETVKELLRLHYATAVDMNNPPPKIYLTGEF